MTRYNFDGLVEVSAGKFDTFQKPHVEMEGLEPTDWSQDDADPGEKSSLLTAALTHLGLYILMFLGFVNQLLFKPKVATEKNREVGDTFCFLCDWFRLI